MTFNQKLGYTTLGAAILFVGMLTAGLLNPIIAQTTSIRDATFGEITCSRLNIVDDNGGVQIKLYSYSGSPWLIMDHAPDDVNSPKITLTSDEDSSSLFIGYSLGSWVDLTTFDDQAIVNLKGPTFNNTMDMRCTKDDSKIELKGGRDGKHFIALKTKSQPNNRNPSSLEDRFFGISMFNHSKSDISRALMFVDESGEGGFSSNGPHDKHLWGSTTRYKK